jgi:hypothetical protein
MPGQVALLLPAMPSIKRRLDLIKETHAAQITRSISLQWTIEIG